MTIGYSDRINHALAYATKHHDQQVRRGTRSPYLTRHANVAVILSRYGGDEDTVVAGILHDVVGDGMRGGGSRESLVGRVGDKFGGDALDLALAVSERRASRSPPQAPTPRKQVARAASVRCSGTQPR